MTNKLLSRSCPICGSAHGGQLHTQRFLEVDGALLPANYDLVECSKCGFVFADVDASQSAYDGYYAQQSAYENEEISSGAGLAAWDLRRLTATADKLCGRLPVAARLLDVGSAMGGLLQILANRGYSNLAALEPSAACVAKLPRSISGHVGTLSEAARALHGQTFDAVIMSHVLEHLYEISAAIRSISEVLTEDGVLYIEVPDASRYKDFFKTSFHFFDVEHINHFDLASLNTLFGLHGFETVESGDKDIEIAEGEFYPAIYSIFRRKRIGLAIAGYIELSETNDNSDLITGLMQSDEPIAIWGFGSYTKRLLATTDLGRCNVRHLVDGDQKKHGMRAGSAVVEAPAVLRSFGGTIVIASALYSGAIKVAAADLGLANPLVVLR